MADDNELSDEEKQLLAKHRAEKARSGRKVKVRGKHDESGAEYEFDLEGDDAERVIARHRALFEEQQDNGDNGDKGGKSGGSGPYFRGKK
jgi:hypothetical protein